MMQIDCHTPPRLVMSGQFNQRCGWTHNGRTLEKNLLMIMQKGDCCLNVKGETHHLNIGDAMIIPAGQYYRPYTEQGCEYYYFHFSVFPPRQEPDPQRIITLPFCVTPKDREREEILRMAQRIYETHTDEIRPESSLAADLYLTLLLVKLSGIAATVTHRDLRSSALLGKMVLYIRQNTTNAITLRTLSDMFSVSEQYITRLFRRYLNMTPTTYIHHIKLENARYLLIHSTMNVTEISDYLGFSGSHYFIRLFKKYYGITPMQYAREELEQEYHPSEESPT